MTRLGIITGMATEAARVAKAADELPENARPLVAAVGGDARKAEEAARKFAHDGVVGLVGDMVRNVDRNVKKAVPPGLYYDLEQMQRAMRDIAIRGDIIYPAHDPLVTEEDKEKRLAALSPGKPWP